MTTESPEQEDYEKQVKDLTKSKVRKTYRFLADPLLFTAAKYMSPVAGVSALVTKLVTKNIHKQGSLKKNYSNKVRKLIYY